MGYKPQKIISFFGDGSKWGIKISYIIEDKLMGTAGAIRGAYKKISELNVFILNGDSFCNFDISDLFKQHHLNNADATLSVLKVDKPENYGLVEFSNNLRINKFIEKSKVHKNEINYINAGVYLLKNHKKYDNSKPVSLKKFFKIQVKNMTLFFGIIGCWYWNQILSSWRFLMEKLNDK